MPVFKLSKGVEVVGLGLYLAKLDALVVADLHIGYEGALAEEGLYVPPFQSQEIRSIIESMARETGASRLILLGDVKHEFGDVTRQEWRETSELLGFVKDDLKMNVEVVRGNHDNYLVALLKKMGVPLRDPFLVEEGVLFFHGHKPLPVEGFAENVETIIMGHEHPAIALRDEVGARLKIKALLEGSYMGKRVIVLPALSPLMPGTEVNVERNFLSPILREADIDSFKAYAIDLEAGVYDFGLIKYLRLASQAPLEL